MFAYHEDSTLKREVLAQLAACREVGELARGRYAENIRRRQTSRAISCTIHSGDTSEYESRLGIPPMLAELKGCLFEGLPHDVTMTWPERFMDAIRPGSDLSSVGWQFLRWQLSDQTTNPGISHPSVNHAVERCAGVLAPLERGVPLNADATQEARAAREATEVAQLSTESPMCQLPNSAFTKYMVWNEWGIDLSAPGSAAEWTRLWSEFAVNLSAAKSPGAATEWAALLASWSADAAKWAMQSVEVWTRSRKISGEFAAESAAWSAAGLVENAAYRRMADKLVDLIKAAPAGSRQCR